MNICAETLFAFFWSRKLALGGQDMTKRILSTLVSVLMTVTMYTPVHAVEEIPAGDEPETVETVQETETPTVAEEVTETEPEESVESAEDSEEASEIEEEPEESEEPAVIAEEPEEPAAEGEPEDAEELEEAGDPEPAEGEEPAADEEPEEESKEEPAAEEPEVFTVTPDPVTYNGVTVTVNYPSDAFGGKEVTLVVGEPGETEREALEALGGEFKAVDISFVDEEGNPVQPVEGKTVNVALIAEGMEASDEYRVAHVDAEGNVDFLDAETETSNEVTERVKTGETTRTVEVPAETETVVVEDYKTETYTDYEVRETTVEVPAETAYHYVRKSREVTRTESTGLLKRLLGMTGKNNNKTKTVTEYYYELEPYVVREAYTKTVTETVPVTRTRQVLVGTHTENRIIRDAYSYEETEDIFEDVTINDVETVFEAKSFSTYALVANSFSTRTAIHSPSRHGALRCP